MLFKNKKGTEMGINTIVVAVIAVVVLIVVIIVFSGKFGLFSSELNNCESTGKGTCVASSSDCTTPGRLMDYKCKESGKVCCVSACSLAGGECGTKTCPDEKVLYATCKQGETCCRK
jgi:hypothetical protein